MKTKMKQEIKNDIEFLDINGGIFFKEHLEKLLKMIPKDKEMMLIIKKGSLGMYKTNKGGDENSKLVL